MCISDALTSFLLLVCIHLLPPFLRAMAKLLAVFLLLLISVSMVSCVIEDVVVESGMHKGIHHPHHMHKGVHHPHHKRNHKRIHHKHHNRGYGPGSLKANQCPAECERRCSRTQYKKPCIFFCNKCCRKCLCVPPGFYRHKEVCPCYNNWKTQQGGPKCP